MLFATNNAVITTLVAAWFLIFTVKIEATNNKQQLLVILLDGFRWDYFNYTPPNGGFQKFIAGGVKAEYMEPLYPSESFPGYYAVVTGLYGENSGIPLNYMYDEKRRTFFKMMPDEGSDHPFWWEDAEPLWVTTTNNHIPTALFLWPGGHVLIKGVRPEIYTKYERVYHVTTFRHDLKKAVNLFATKEIQYAQVYCEFPDLYGHASGPEMVMEDLIPRYLDGIISELLDNVENKKLTDSLNIVILSDHGMTDTDRFHVKTIQLSDVLNPDDVEYVLDRGSHVGIYPGKEKFDEVYRKLKKVEGLNVYKREEIPEKFHIKNSLRVPPIYVEAIKGYYIVGLPSDEKQIPRDSYEWQWFGFHGYNAESFPDMRAIFLAKGPAFKRGLVTPPISIVDPYNLFTHLLGIQPLPNNGSWSHVKDMLV